jgi:acylpyruvate hydrolase
VKLATIRTAAGAAAIRLDGDHAVELGLPDVGELLNYRSHILEMGRELPAYPTLFAKFSSALVGAHDDIMLPAVSGQAGWEAELGLVIGTAVRHASPAQATAAMAGYTIVNDVSMRDWQWRTSEWLQGKAFEASTPVGPWLVTPADIVAYISQFTTLDPGDLIATGTPGGVGAGRKPQLFLGPDQTLVTAIDGLGELRNRCVAEARGTR